MDAPAFEVEASAAFRFNHPFLDRMIWSLTLDATLRGAGALLTYEIKRNRHFNTTTLSTQQSHLQHNNIINTTFTFSQAIYLVDDAVQHLSNSLRGLAR